MWIEFSDDVERELVTLARALRCSPSALIKIWADIMLDRSRILHTLRADAQEPGEQPPTSAARPSQGR